MDWANIERKRIHIVGIKGAGCAALAEILHHRGAHLSGSDNPENFYTSLMLDALKITIYHQFDQEHITKEIDLVIHSAAYNQRNVELARAVALGLSILSYPEALGKLSQQSYSIAVAGVHGKTTTTAMLGLIAKEQGWPATTLVGSLVGGFGNRATYCAGSEIFIAETCEYREHFMHFHPNAILLTAIEWDHQDYYKSPQQLRDAFFRFIQRLPNGGILLYNADDPEVMMVVAQVQEARQDLSYRSFGHLHSVDYALSHEAVAGEMNTFSLSGWVDSVAIPLAGKHNRANAGMALAMAREIALQRGIDFSGDRARQSMRSFHGLTRRLELVGYDKARNIIVLDDYAHHPTAIEKTILGLREFYPERRIILSFMSHTYSRTHALLADFARTIALADVVILHKIYASAREHKPENFSSQDLLTATEAEKVSDLYYIEEPLDALALLRTLLQPNDLFITMGAGDNFHLSHQLIKEWASW